MSKEQKKILLFFSLVIIGFFAFYVWMDYSMPLGSRRPEESYRFHITEAQLIQAIHKFKMENPDFVVPKDSLAKLFPMKEEYYDTTYFIHKHYFIIYFKNENRFFFFDTRIVPGVGSDIELISILEESFSRGNWLTVNAYLKGEKNKEVKKEFEEEFLDKLGVRYSDIGNSMPIFYDLFHSMGLVH